MISSSVLSRPSRLGVAQSDSTTTFSVFSRHATSLQLCLFQSPNDRTESERLEMSRDGDIWVASVDNVDPGTAYGFRAGGPFAPSEGHRFNPEKLLVDPYARSIVGSPTWHRALYGSEPSSDAPDGRDSAPFAPRSVVVDDAFDWQDTVKPRRPLSDSVIYELHVKGFTAQHPDVPPHLRGTYGGLAHPAVIEYLTHLGVTAVELLPVHASVDDPFLVERGLRNYWGYQTLGFFAPHRRYASNATPGGEVTEFKEMVRELHRAGIEVILDVVYNHTCEANHLGPTLSFRGLDNASYYRLCDDPRYYMDVTGTGNSLDADSPAVQRLVLDSLHYWVHEMGVDGFRFDLATTLGRDHRGYRADHPLLTAIALDAQLRDVKLIAEPWDVGSGGYQLSRFPTRFSEWNDRFRDTARGFWRGMPHTLPELGARLTGSSDIFDELRRHPSASVNYITAHDGLTLRDLVSYSGKRNGANGDLNRDGASEHLSNGLQRDGHSREGVLQRRRFDRMRAMLATLLVARGIPMLLAGDERGKSQQGNNNAYCHDDALTYIDWHDTSLSASLVPFVAELVRLRKEEPLLRTDAWPGAGFGHPDAIHWFTADGCFMQDHQWHERNRRAIGFVVQSQEHDHEIVVLINGGENDVLFRLPSWLTDSGRAVARLISSSTRISSNDPAELAPAGSLTVLRVGGFTLGA